MNPTELVSPATPVPPTSREMVMEIVPLVGAVAGYGPPVISLAGPLVLLALVLSAPFAVLLTLLAAMFVAATLVLAVAAMVLAAPYLLIGRLRSVRPRRARSGLRAGRLAPVGHRRVAT